MAYSSETARADPLVRAAAAAAADRIRAPIAAHSLGALDRLVDDVRGALQHAIATINAEAETTLRRAVYDAAADIATQFIRLRQASAGWFDDAKNERPPYAEYPRGREFVPREDGVDSDSPMSFAVLKSEAESSGYLHTVQAWDAYGDCVIGHTRGCDNKIVWTSKAPIIGLREKLTPEYQEILWHIAKVTNASFLRGVFDRYHPDIGDVARAARMREQCRTERTALTAERAALTAREAECARKEREVASVADTVYDCAQAAAEVHVEQRQRALDAQRAALDAAAARVADAEQAVAQASAKLCAAEESDRRYRELRAAVQNTGHEFAGCTEVTMALIVGRFVHWALTLPA